MRLVQQPDLRSACVQAAMAQTRRKATNPGAAGVPHSSSPCLRIAELLKSDVDAAAVLNAGRLL